MLSKTEKPYVIYLAEVIYKNIADIKKLLTGSNKAEEAKTSDEFFMLVKSRIEKNSKIIDLTKQ